MSANLERFQKDLEKLISTGQRLELAMRQYCMPEEFERQVKEQLGKEADKVIKELPSFKNGYQRWYSESLVLIRQLLPDRIEDFVRHYQIPKGRKDITSDNYRIEDCLQGLSVIRGYDKEKVVGLEAAVPHFAQQLAIVEAAQARFSSSLFEMRQLMQADFLDSEMAAAEELAKHKYVRASGALAGVAIEKHLAQVCADHNIPISKKNPNISDFNEALRSNGVIDVPQWRFVQHLADIRNLCDHGRKPEPTPEQVTDLLAGVKKIIKTVS
jgi:hypothetical protein